MQQHWLFHSGFVLLLTKLVKGIAKALLNAIQSHHSKWYIFYLNVKIKILYTKSTLVTNNLDVTTNEIIIDPPSVHKDKKATDGNQFEHWDIHDDFRCFQLLNFDIFLPTFS
jgi:hypothetical protein